MEIKEEYTRVSKILNQWNQLAHIDPKVLSNKCRIGTNVHEKINAELQGIFLDLREDEKNYFHSWEKWWKESEMSSNLVCTEKRFYCDSLKITGCVDALVKGKNGMHVVDYKTSHSVNKKIWPLQGAFYRHLASLSGDKISPDVWFVKLAKDGKKGRVYHFEIDDYIWDVCQSALETFRYLNG